MKKKKVKTAEFDDENEFEKVFEKIESLKEFKQWFGDNACKDFCAGCANCYFWNKWNGLKADLWGYYFR